MLPRDLACGNIATLGAITTLARLVSNRKALEASLAAFLDEHPPKELGDPTHTRTVNYRMHEIEYIVNTQIPLILKRIVRLRSADQVKALPLPASAIRNILMFLDSQVDIEDEPGYIAYDFLRLTGGASDSEGSDDSDDSDQEDVDERPAPPPGPPPARAIEAIGMLYTQYAGQTFYMEAMSSIEVADDEVHLVVKMRKPRSAAVTESIRRGSMAPGAEPNITWRAEVARAYTSPLTNRPPPLRAVATPTHAELIEPAPASPDRKPHEGSDPEAVHRSDAADARRFGICVRRKTLLDKLCGMTVFYRGAPRVLRIAASTHTFIIPDPG